MIWETIIKNNLSPNGQVSVDERTNTIIIRDLPKNIEEIRDLIGALDRSLPQVLIRADIVELSTDAEKDLGIEWEVGISASGATQATTFPFYMDRPTTYQKLERVWSETGGWAAGEGLVPTFTFGTAFFC